ncbi:MAG: glycoside hydrolase family 88 protein [Verrucomicrobiia bacterium]
MLVSFLSVPNSIAQDLTNAPALSGGITDAEIGNIVVRVARHQIHELKDGDYAPVKTIEEARAARPPEGIEWGPESYPQGVSLCGMLRSTAVTGDEDVDKSVVEYNLTCARYCNWLAGLEKDLGKSPELSSFVLTTKIRGLMKPGSLDSCGAIGNEILESMMRHPDQVTPEEREVVARCADWVVLKQSRLPDGTFSRSGPTGPTIWPDDLYMGGVFLVGWGKYTGEQKFIDDAANQIIHQAAVEQDGDGLWFHSYFVDGKKHAPFKWGRGNGWATLALVETLSAMPENNPFRQKLLEILRNQIEGLKKVQAPDGMWRQVLDKPDLWEETSCTAMFAYGIARAVNRGWIDPTNMAVARKAFEGISKNVTPAGAIENTCEGTGVGLDLDYYAKRRRPHDDPHGRGPVMIAGTEILMAGKK